MAFKTKNKKLAEEAEERAVMHFEKLNKIEQIIMIEESKKTPAVYIVDKIKEVITSDQTNK